MSDELTIARNSALRAGSEIRRCVRAMGRAVLASESLCAYAPAFLFAALVTAFVVL